MLGLRCSDLECFVVGRNYRSNHGFGRRGNREERQEDDTKKKDTASLQMMHAKIELLSRQEQEICKLLKLTPAQYLACKGGVLREAAGGPVRKSRVKALMNVEKGRASRLCAPYCKPRNPNLNLAV